MKIIDAHHHYWDPKANYHPWLRDEPMIPFRYGDYAEIRKPFLPDDYDHCAKAWDIAANVTMEGEWNPADPCGEALWMQQLANKTGRPAAHVAQAWLDSDDLQTQLECYQQLPLVRSVRHKPRANSSTGGPPGGMCDDAFREGFKLLADHGLMFDLQTPWWHLHEAVELAALAPSVPVILNHAGLPSDRSDTALLAWRQAMKQFADLPQAYVKISGLGLPGKAWAIEDNLEIIQTCIELFGPERSMFASNFPVDGLCGSFDTIYSGFSLSVKSESQFVKDSLFWKTAAKIYRLTGFDQS